MNRQAVFEWVKQQYGTAPEYLWMAHPNYAVLRNESGKWYAAIMDIPKHKLGLSGSEKVDVLNVKCDPLLIGSFCLQAGFLPAYHMNKNHWISILLDDTVADDEIKSLIDMSHTRTQPKKRRKTNG